MNRLITLLATFVLISCQSQEPPPWGLPDGFAFDGSGNSPPELVRIGDRVVAVGETLIIELKANDPDGDALTFSSFGKLPAGSKFHKAEHRFEWTPTITGQTVYLTFVVSDGQSFDRETIRIEVVTEKSNHAPQFQVVGDQQAIVAKPFSLELVATDADGDPIKFSVDGELPVQSNLDPATGVFVWTPTPDLAGQTIRITFVVSDGKLSEAMDVNFIVYKDGATAGPAPPVFAAIPPQTAELGKTFTLKLVATDPNSDPLTFGIYNGGPPNGTLSGDIFSYTPNSDEEGFTYVTTFSVTDGVFTAYQAVDITVKTAAGPITCFDDPGEPNESLFNASPVVEGVHQFSLCDTELVPQDKDYFSIFVPSGQSLNVSLTHDPEAGDVDFLIVDSNHITLAVAATGAATEQATAKTAINQELYIYVYGVAQPEYHVPYSLSVSLSVTQACADDVHEPNETWQTAKALPPQGSPLQICAANPDWWSFQLQCGEDFKVTLDTGNQGDLDMHLYGASGNDGLLLDAAATAAVIEVLDFKNAPSAGTYTLRVIGFPSAVTEAPYTMLTEFTGVCVEDGQAGSAQWDAKQLVGGDGQLLGLRICCKNDWFKIDLAQGQTLMGSVVAFTPGGSAGLTFYDEFQNKLVATVPSPGGGSLQLTAPSTSTYYMEVEGSVDTEYKLEWVIVNQVGEGCTTLSCPKFEVCDASTGECVSDFCFVDDDCPSGYQCKETYCANPCTQEIDCRFDYGCKAFEEGQFCGITGNSPYGQWCMNHTNCITSAVCAFKQNGGYCAPMGCLENNIVCPTGTYCTYQFGEVSICGLKCYSDNDCRVDDGYACEHFDFDPVGVCLP